MTGIDSEYADSIFTELSQMDVHLDADPLQFGPKRLNGKVALARKMLSRCEALFNEVAQQLASYKRKLRSAQLILDLAKKHLLANDPEVRAGRAVSERDAIATGKLKEEVQAVATCEHAVEDLGAILEVIKAKRQDLRDIQSRIRDQVRLCQEEIGLGSHWGSKSPRGVEWEKGQGFANGQDVADVELVIQEARTITEAELHLKAEIDDTDPEEDQENSLKVAGEEESSFEETFEVTDTPVGQLLPSSAKDADVDSFLSTPLPKQESPKPLSRRALEEVNSDIDVDSILANFLE